MSSRIVSPLGFTRVTGRSLADTLLFKLRRTADKLRDLHTRFGNRPYVVSIVRTRWTGGQRGKGIEEVVQQLILEPTPKVEDMDGVPITIHPIGADEVGGVHVSEISGRYTEYELRGYDRDGNPPGPNDTIFWEVEFPTPGERENTSFRRRFIMSGVPKYESGRLQWTVALERSHNDRKPSGALR